MVNKIVYDYAGNVADLFAGDLHFLGLIGSYAVGEESIVNGKPVSDIDYYAVLKRNVSEQKFTNPVRTFKKQFNARNGVPASIWVVPYDNFYGANRDDTLTPYQLAETNAVLRGDVSMLDNVRGRPIEYNSHIGLSGVAFMDACNGNFAKALFNQIGVLLIPNGLFRTSYRDRISQFLSLHPEYDMLRGEFETALKNKMSPKEFPTFNFDMFRFLFALDIMNDIFGFGRDLKMFCDNVVEDGDLHKFIRASYIAFYHGNYELADKYSEECCRRLGIEYAGNDTLNRLNNTWFNWLNGIGIYDEPMASK